MTEKTCELLVIGGGPGGYACAARAGQLGIDTILIEKQRLGGVCLNVGCIPSKALIHVAEMFEHATSFAGESPLGISAGAPAIDLAATQRWKDGVVERLNRGVAGMLDRAKVKVLAGEADFLDGKSVRVTTADGPVIVRAQTVVIATGSAPIELPDLPFEEPVISSSEAVALDAVPERLVIVGAGYIGLEIGTALGKLGAAVTIVEAAERILPLYDAALTRPVRERLDSLGIAVMTSARVKGLKAGHVVVEDAEGERHRLAADKVLVTVGRRPSTRGFGLEDLALTMDGDAIRIDQQCRTSMRGVYAIGDVTGEPMLAHRATAQGVMVAEIVAGRRRAWQPRCIPAICFTDPEIVTAGLSPDAARAAGHEIETGQLPFRANGRALSMAREDGWIRVVARRDNSLVLGLQAVGAGVSELSAAFATALEMGSTLDDLAGVIYAHPTRGEALGEAAALALP